MNKILKSSDSDFLKKFHEVVNYDRSEILDVSSVVSDIIKNVRERGDAAVIEYTSKLDRNNEIQLEVSNQPVTTEIKRILETAGEVGIVDADKKIYNVRLDSNTKTIYRKLRNLIERYGVYRTYNYEKVKKSQVFLEDLRLPQDFVKELLNEN